MALWDLRYPGVADRNRAAWPRWGRQSRLEPVRKVAAMVKRHWVNIRTCFTHRITNAGAEAINAKIGRRSDGPAGSAAASASAPRSTSTAAGSTSTRQA
jgi:hypothetical protein